jgi:hypothetical protein
LCVCNSVANILKNEQFAKGNKIIDNRLERIDNRVERRKKMKNGIGLKCKKLLRSTISAF